MTLCLSRDQLDQFVFLNTVKRSTHCVTDVSDNYYFLIFVRLDIDYAGKMAVVTGWGRVNETGNISPILRQVDVPVYTNADCHKTKYGEDAITENMMCAGYDEGKLDACQGDSGGPLHLEGKDRKIDLIGIELHKRDQYLKINFNYSTKNGA
jgi:hypothetical protein